MAGTTETARGGGGGVVVTGTDIIICILIGIVTMTVSSLISSILSTHIPHLSPSLTVLSLPLSAGLYLMSSERGGRVT